MELTRKAGERVLPLVRRAKEELTIYSPFISPTYADLLVEKAKKGVNVRVFTTEHGAGYHRVALRKFQQDLSRPKTKRNIGLGLVFAGVVCALIASVFGTLVLVPSVLMLVGGGYALAKHLQECESQAEPQGDIKVQIVNGLHAKVYSRDNGEEVVFGSANLTSSGMNGNLEVVSDFLDFSEETKEVMYA